MKKLTTHLPTLLLLLLAVAAPRPELAAQEQAAVIDKVIARVGGEFILLSELEEQIALAASQNPEELPPDARCRFLDQLLVGKLLYNQSKLDSIEVADNEVEQQLNARIDRILSYMGGDVKQFEEYYGQSITATKEQFREDLREQIATERVRGTVVRGVKVTPAEVKRFFREIPADSLPYFNSEVEIGEIVARPRPSDSTNEATVGRLEDIRARIESGELTFEDAARQFSADGSANAGGDLGWTKRGKFVPEFEAAAYNLEPGQLSEVTETEFGFHLIKMSARRGNSIRVSHILLRPEIREADIELARNALDTVAQLLRDDSLNFSLAVKRFGYDKVQSYNNDGRMTNPKSGDTFFEIADLDPDVYFTIDDMEIGGVSAPLDYRSPTGEPMLRIVQLRSRTDPHRASLDQDYARIQDATKSAKQQDFLEDWLTERVGSTFVQIDDRYDACPNLRMWREESRKITVGANQ